MTFTYLGTGSTKLDIIRRMIGDKDSDDALMTDEELNAILTENENNLTKSAAVACEEIASAFARQSVVAVGDMTQDLFQKSENYRKQARIFRAREDGGEDEPQTAGPGYNKIALAKGSKWRR